MTLLPIKTKVRVAAEGPFHGMTGWVKAHTQVDHELVHAQQALDPDLTDQEKCNCTPNMHLVRFDKPHEELGHQHWFALSEIVPL